MISHDIRSFEDRRCLYMPRAFLHTRYPSKARTVRKCLEDVKLHVTRPLSVEGWFDDFIHGMPPKSCNFCSQLFQRVGWHLSGGIWNSDRNRSCNPAYRADVFSSIAMWGLTKVYCMHWPSANGVDSFHPSHKITAWTRDRFFLIGRGQLELADLDDQNTSNR